MAQTMSPVPTMTITPTMTYTPTPTMTATPTTTPEPLKYELLGKLEKWTLKNFKSEL